MHIINITARSIALFFFLIFTAINTNNMINSSNWIEQATIDYTFHYLSMNIAYNELYNITMPIKQVNTLIRVELISFILIFYSSGNAINIFLYYLLITKLIFIACFTFFTILNTEFEGTWSSSSLSNNKSCRDSSSIC